MTREDLEKAIKNGKSLWYIFMKEIFKIEIKKHINQFISRDNEYCYTDEKKVERCFPIEVLFKTKAEAEHYLNHANITRIEQLPFLTWEEFDEGDRLIRFIGKNGEKCKLEGYQKDDKQSGFIDVVVNGTGSNIDFDYTEANFYKAYDECVRLFRGGE